MKITSVRCLHGQEIEPCIDAIAQLRIEVFREFPYLYDGTLDYETDYLKVYLRSEKSVVVVAEDEDRIVGASTALPMTDADEAFQKPFHEQGHAVEDIYYLGESVLLKSYRGLGVGHQFFDHREACARKYGYAKTTFCAVERPVDHPLRPGDYRSLEPFWKKRGYAHHPELKAEFAWKTIDVSAGEVNHVLSFWVKA